MNRTAREHRKTNETDVSIVVDLDGTGTAAVSTGVGFFEHLLTAFAHTSMFDLTVDTVGDLHVDDHHTVEDTCLVLGTAISSALGDRAGIARYGEGVVPMDEALARVAVDVGGRAYTVNDLALSTDRIGALSTQMIPHGLEALSRSGGITLHATAGGSNDHHVAEATFKALGVAMRAAVAIDPRRVGLPSTKGAI